MQHPAAANDDAHPSGCGLCLLLDVCTHEVAQELRGGAVAGFGSGCELGFESFIYPKRESDIAHAPHAVSWARARSSAVALPPDSSAWATKCSTPLESQASSTPGA